ncbi:MAG TPA: hypothetical protein VFK20_04215 [Vicinamibacterales bacterium]|nr:hypothetical protein [Vicinamibacterales bacterium]
MGPEVKRFGRYLEVIALTIGIFAASSAIGAPARVESPAEVRADHPTVAVQPAHGVRDEAAMVVVGAALIGLASAVRRAA